jgi:hypothetical protein
MASTTGTVRCVQVGEFAGWTQIEDASGEREIFILWFNPGVTIPQELTAFTRVLHSMWLSLLREAQTNTSTVTIFHPENSAEVTDIVLGEAVLFG